MSKLSKARVAATAQVLCFLVIPAALAEEALGSRAPDKSTFSFFNPTPSESLREMDTDGPGTTESPYTVDAGHFQCEMTFVSYAHDRESFNGVSYRLDAWAIAPLILKVGLHDRLDAQLVLEPYHLVYEREDGTRVTRRGFGDTTVRLKYNLWGNDGGSTALAATPYAKIPTSEDGLGNDSFEGGVILPMALTLPGDFYVGLTTRFDAVRDEDNRGYHPEFGNSIAFGHDLFGNLFGYVEFFTAVSTERNADWIGILGPGLIYVLTDNLQLKAGVNIGVTHSADDLNPFIGMAWRF